MHQTRLLRVVIALAAGCNGGRGAGAAGSAAAGSAAPGSGTAGSGTAGSPAAGSPAATPPGKPVRAALLDDAGGKPLVLALDAGGHLVARSADGAFLRVLLPGPYGDAAPDDARDLVWLRSDTKLDVLDLRAPGPAVARTLATSPEKAIEKLGQHITEPPRWTMATYVNIMLETPCKRGAGLRLDWAHDGAGTTTGGEAVRVVARDWFVAEENRARRTPPDGFSVPETKPRKIPRAVGTCHGDAKDELGRLACGASVAFGATGRELVVVGASAERCPAKHCQLYDPRTRKFSPVPGFDPDDKAAPTCGPFQFDTAGTSYLVGDKLCGRDLTCSSLGRLAIGWLDANRDVDAN